MPAWRHELMEEKGAAHPNTRRIPSPPVLALLDGVQELLDASAVEIADIH
jgi:hypothetical protein